MTDTDREKNCNKDQEKDIKRQETPIPLILKKFMENEYSPELQFHFAEWLDQNKHQQEVAEYLRKEFDAIPAIAPQDENARAMTEKRLQKLKNAINQTNQEGIFPKANENKTEQIDSDKIELTKQRSQRIPLSRWMLRVAAVLIPLVIALGTYLLTQTGGHDLPNMAQVATQTEIEAPLGTQKEDILPEGSKVWVNAGSKIAYTDDLQNKQRKAELRGEAYFSVTKNNEKPFIVETDYLTVKVLGTQFNIKAYPGEDKTVVTLDEGKVEVKTKNGAMYVLEPNQQLIFDKKTGEVKIVVPKREADASNWKNGQLVFDDLTFQEILHAMERRYNVSIEIDPLVLTNKEYSVKFVQNENIADAMQIMQKMVQGFSYEISEKRVVIKKE